MNAKPLGRNPQAVSPVVQLENAALKSLSLLVREHGPVNSAFKAARYRHLHAVLHRRPPYEVE